MQKYNFSNPKSVVEVTEHHSSFVVLKPGERAFDCLCRGYGHNNHGPRREYVIIAATPSQAARVAMEKYRKEFAAV